MPDTDHSSFVDLSAPNPDRWLPLNRKERYCTGTVLPMVTASDGFAHPRRLLALCGLGSVQPVVGGLDGGDEIAFFTDYGFSESVYTPADREARPGQKRPQEIPRTSRDRTRLAPRHRSQDVPQPFRRAPRTTDEEAGPS